MRGSAVRSIAQFLGIMGAIGIAMTLLFGFRGAPQPPELSGEANKLQGINPDPYSKDMTESVYVGDGIWLFNDLTSATAQEIRQQVSASLPGKITKVESAQILANERYYYFSRVNFLGPNGNGRRQLFICTGNSPPPGRLANQWITGFEDTTLVPTDFVILCREYQHGLQAASGESRADRKARLNVTMDEWEEDWREMLRRAKAMTDDELQKMQNEAAPARGT